MAETESEYQPKTTTVSVQQLVRLRGAHRSAASKLVSRIDDFVERISYVTRSSPEWQGEDPSVNDREDSALDLKKLREKVDLLGRLDSQILDAIEDDDIESEICDAADYLMKYESRIGRATRAISDASQLLENIASVRASQSSQPKSLSPVSGKDECCTTSKAKGNLDSRESAPDETGEDSPVVAPCVSRSSVVSSTSASSGSSFHHRMKLPKLEIPKFSGDIRAWSSFWDMFGSAIDGNDTLDDVDKFNYLKSLVVGEAREAIAGFPLTGANYRAAVDVLKQRFGNVQVIVASHMESLLNVASVTSEDDVTGLRKLYTTVETHIRSLQSLGMSRKSYGSLLTSVLMSRLSAEFRLIVSRKIVGTEQHWEIGELLSAVHLELCARERAAPAAKPTSPIAQPRKSAPATMSTLYTGAPEQLKCFFCIGSQTAGRCVTVTNVATRRQILRKQGRCFRCLKRNHMAKTCPNAYSCVKCGGSHNVAICSGERQQKAEMNTQAVAANASMDPRRQESVLLQTAKAVAYNVTQSDRSAAIRLLMDGGSQRTYVTSALRDALQLPVLDQRKVIIKAFGQDNTTSQVVDVVQLGIRVPDGEDITVQAYAVPLLCDPITGQSMHTSVECCSHLDGLALADTRYDTGTRSVDLLIGADLYWTIATGNII